MTPDILSDIKERLYKKDIHEVRSIARAVGVARPSSGKKERIINDIVAIASCQVKPAPKNKRGAPPKSSEYDEDLVKDIRACIEYNTLLKEGTKTENGKFEVSDGTANIICQGVLVKTEGNFYLRACGCLPSEDDICVHEAYINRFGLKEGDLVKGECRRNFTDEVASLTKVLSVNGYAPHSVPRREFGKLTPVYPKNRIYIANSGDITARMIDLFAPVGCGQRAVISAPANSNKTALIKQIAGISPNEQHISKVLFIVGGSPEEVTDIQRTACDCTVFYTTFDMEHNQHAQAAEFVATYCKNMVECGRDVVLIVDGLSKLEGSAKRLLSSAICAEEGGSLTVIATVSAEGEYSSEYSAELLSVANMRVVLCDNANTSAIDIAKSYTLRSEYLQSEQELKTAHMLRNSYKMTENIQDILNVFKNTKNNTEIIKSNG